MFENFAVMVGESFKVAYRDFVDNASTLSGDDKSFESGYLMGLHRMFTLLEQAADACEIPMTDISLGEMTEEDFFK
jgi:hypothetical protein